MEDNKKSGISRKNLGYILALLGVVLVVLSYFLVFTKYNEKCDDVKNELSSLRERRDQLEVLNSTKGDIAEATETAKTDREELLKKYAAGITLKSKIMDTYNMTQDLQIKIPTLAMAVPTEVYTFGGITSSNPNGGTVANDSNLSGKCMSYSIQTIGTYEQMKNIFKYFTDTKGYRRVPQSVTIQYDAGTEQVSMAITANEYVITGDGRDFVSPEVPGYVEGTMNIFYNQVLTQ